MIDPQTVKALQETYAVLEALCAASPRAPSLVDLRNAIADGQRPPNDDIGGAV
jgi:hypothetical protein